MYKQINIHLYRHTSFYCTSVYHASQILCFLQVEGLWQPCVEQVYWCYFSNSTCSLHVSVPHFGNSRKISNFFITIIFVIVISFLNYFLFFIF